MQDKYIICQLPSNSTIPEWGNLGEIFAVIRTSDELTVVCRETNIPGNVKFESGWRVLKVQGPLEFSQVGVISKLATTLADVDASIFILSTYDTDYILIKDSNLKQAIRALQQVGYRIKSPR
jgi:hypothetical protein